MGETVGQLSLKNILVVCVGNICRSPVGEQLLQRYLPESSVCSAGLNAIVGHDVDSTMVAVAADRGFDIKTHSARQLTQSLCRAHDLILVMETNHISKLAHIAPEAQGKTLLFGHWIRQMEIFDPFNRQPSFNDYVFIQLRDCALQWSSVLKSA